MHDGEHSILIAPPLPSPAPAPPGSWPISGPLPTIEDDTDRGSVSSYETGHETLLVDVPETPPYAGTVLVLEPELEELESSGRLIDIRVQGRRRHSAHIAKRDDQWDEDGDLPRIDTEFSEGQKDKTQTRRGVPEGCAARKQRE